MPDGTIAAVLDWVGADRERAQRALDAEADRDMPRTSLITALDKLLDADD